MPQKKANTGVRKAKQPKAGRGRAGHTNVFRTVKEKDSTTGEVTEKQELCRENLRHGKGSGNKGWKYTGCPLSCYK